MPEGNKFVLDYIIARDGTVDSVVVERGGENCEKIHQLNSFLGRPSSEERTGPDCDRVEEVTFD
jgi:hypothetical protein